MSNTKTPSEKAEIARVVALMRAEADSLYSQGIADDIRHYADQVESGFCGPVSGLSELEELLRGNPLRK
jgi:hypothetical protein